MRTGGMLGILLCFVWRRVTLSVTDGGKHNDCMIANPNSSFKLVNGADHCQSLSQCHPRRHADDHGGGRSPGESVTVQRV